MFIGGLSWQTTQGKIPVLTPEVSPTDPAWDGTRTPSRRAVLFDYSLFRFLQKVPLICVVLWD